MGDPVVPPKKDNSYSYSAAIKSPPQMGMSPAGTLNAIGTNVGGIISYVQLLVTGASNASKTGRPLGNKYFSTTPAFCKDVASKAPVRRSIYVNNMPDGNFTLPFSSQGMELGEGVSGLLPGVIANLSRLNPLAIIDSMAQGTDQECHDITMEVIGNDNVSDIDHAYVTKFDISRMPPSWFLRDYPKSLYERFENREHGRSQASRQGQASGQAKLDRMPNDLFIKLYYSSLGLLGLYILLKMILYKRLR
jgi:hypothetical protein